MQKVLITGASRGIGKATADLFRENGYEVIMPNRSVLDLSDDKSVASFVEANKDTRFEVIINNAGINEINYIENITDNDIASTLQINLIAPMKLLRGLVPNMKLARSGRIVNIGSIWGVAAKGGRAVYSATKHGIHGLTQTLAVELAPYKILVNTVNPGFTLTELTYKNNTEKQIAEISKEIPLGYMAQPKDIAKAVFFLGSEKNTYITGQYLTVDGGYTVK